MVAAAVHAGVDPGGIRSVEGMAFATSRKQPTLAATLSVASEAVSGLPGEPSGTVVAEHGEFYEEPVGRVEVEFRQEFKYVESIGERETVQAAHHAAYAVRELLR